MLIRATSEVVGIPNAPATIMPVRIHRMIFTAERMKPLRVASSLGAFFRILSRSLSTICITMKQTRKVNTALISVDSAMEPMDTFSSTP